MGLGDFFRTVAETKELHRDPSLRSRYYKVNYTKAKERVLEYANKHNIQVKNIDDTHRELFLQGSRYHVIVSILQVNPIETSIDFKVEVYGLFGFNKPKKTILSFYKYLNETLTFKGTGLHP
jgi:hypothetical protein